MRALEIISAEHRGMWRLTVALDTISQSMELSGSSTEAKIVGTMLDYLSSYIDRLHHPKEDGCLFQLLGARNPQAAAEIAQLQTEHLEGPGQLALLQSLALRVSRGHDEDRTAFFENLRRYTANLRAHIRLEETTVLPLAMQTLTDRDWQDIDAAFLDNDDPLFGANARAEFVVLRARIAALAPDPVSFSRSLGSGQPIGEPTLRAD